MRRGVCCDYQLFNQTISWGEKNPFNYQRFLLGKSILLFVIGLWTFQNQSSPKFHSAIPHGQSKDRDGIPLVKKQRTIKLISKVLFYSNMRSVVKDAVWQSYKISKMVILSWWQQYDHHPILRKIQGKKLNWYMNIPLLNSNGNENGPFPPNNHPRQWVTTEQMVT